MIDITFETIAWHTGLTGKTNVTFGTTWALKEIDWIENLFWNYAIKRTSVPGNRTVPGWPGAPGGPGQPYESTDKKKDFSSNGYLHQHRNVRANLGHPVDQGQHLENLLNHQVHPKIHFIFRNKEIQSLTKSPGRPGIPAAPGRPSNPLRPSSPASP